MRVVATAGHVDHGKSSLVLALTGTDPDRFAEEKRRGLTIDLGFAHTVLPSGAGISFVDVPGHVRFLRNMLAGVGAVDACLFVVAATEGWKPQSEEHVRILDLLGLADGVIALTKIDQVDADDAELAALDVADHVAGTFLEHAAVVPVAVPPVGPAVNLDGLRAALDELVTRVPAAADRGRPRLWVDRSFAAKGSGTVVTGTLTGGPLAVGDEVVTLPAGRTARVRAVQSLGRDLDSIGPGNRVALNLVGVDHADLPRGHAVVRDGQWHVTTTVDASLDVLGSLDHDVSRRGAYLAYVGSGEHPVRVRVLGPGAIAPGARGAVRLHLPVGLPLVPGDRYVLRESGRDETVGGGEILDVAPVLRASRARPDRDVDRVVAERGWVEAAELARLTGVRRGPGRRRLGRGARRPRRRPRRPASTHRGRRTARPRDRSSSTSGSGRCCGRSTASPSTAAVPAPPVPPTRWPTIPSSALLAAGGTAPPAPEGVDAGRAAGAGPPGRAGRAGRAVVPRRRRRRRRPRRRRSCSPPTRPGSRWPSSATPAPPPASTRCRWPTSSTPGASPAAAETSASPAPASPPLDPCRSRSREDVGRLAVRR